MIEFLLCEGSVDWSREAINSMEWFPFWKGRKVYKKTQDHESFMEERAGMDHSL